MTPGNDAVVLVPATSADADLLSNLLELYTHDLSDVFPHVTLGADGRFGYAALPRYWSEPDRRFAFLIRDDARLVGFVLASRGSSGAPEADVYDVAEFFVLKQYRRAGIARRAAQTLWQRLPGRWTVRVSVRNAGALRFWPAVIDACAEKPVQVTTSPDWQVFTFSVNATPST